MPEPLDTELINDLREIMEDEFFSLIETFLVESEKQYSQAQDAWQQHDLEELRRAAHSLKGSCGNVGAMELHAVCGPLEHHAKEGEVGGIDELLAQAEQMLAEASNAIRLL